jgi:CheY-like chemotaxis protein
MFHYGGGRVRLDVGEDRPGWRNETHTAVNSSERGSVPSPTRTLSADVLVIEDEEDIRRTVSEILRFSGFVVAEAENGEIALNLLRRHDYGMLLLDIRTPVRDGLSLLEALEEIPPVVVHSAIALDVGQRARLGDKVVRYLRKPVAPQELLDVVEDVIGRGHRVA